MGAGEIYLYGMTLMTASHRLAADFPERDNYCEIAESHRLPGGETGTCAIVLNGLGLTVQLDGNFLGRNTYPALLEFFDPTSVATDLMTYDPDFDGLEDIVFIDKNTRTAFGRFGQFYADESVRLWNAPNEAAIRQAKVAGLDPFFLEESVAAARLCNKHDVPFVTIDCRADAEMHGRSAVNIVAGEFLRSNYSGEDWRSVFSQYAERTSGLVIFTFGAEEIWYGRNGQGVNMAKPCRVEVQSTLGAGDAFKAGVIYALYNDMDDVTLVRFASATAAAACMHYPIAERPPSLQAIETVLSGISTRQ